MMTTHTTPDPFASDEEAVQLDGKTAVAAPTSFQINIRAVADVFAGFLLMFNAWGIANSFGLFQTFYKTSILHDQSDSTISWIGSSQAFLLLFGGVFVGPIYDAGLGRAIVAFGTFLMVFGLMMTSLCTQFWQILLAQGICLGLGFGCLLTPAMATIIAHFPKRTNVAMGFATSGSGIGAVIYPILFHNILPKIGFPWATRVLAFMVLGTQLLALLLIRVKGRSKKKRPMVDVSMIHNIPYSVFTAGQFFGYMGLYIPLFYIQTYAASIGIGSELAFYSFVILNAVSTAGRIVPNIFAHKIGPINTAIICTLACGILGFCWIAIKETASLIIFCILYGFFSGTYVAISAPAISSTSRNPDLLGTHLGMSFGVAALGVLVGNPVAGVLLQDVGWVSAQSFAASACMISVILMVAARLTLTGPRFWSKA